MRQHRKAAGSVNGIDHILCGRLFIHHGLLPGKQTKNMVNAAAAVAAAYVDLITAVYGKILKMLLRTEFPMVGKGNGIVACGTVDGYHLLRCLSAIRDGGMVVQSRYT